MLETITLNYRKRITTNKVPAKKSSRYSRPKRIRITEMKDIGINVDAVLRNCSPSYRKQKAREHNPSEAYPMISLYF